MSSSRASILTAGLQVALAALATVSLPAWAATYTWVGDPTSNEWSQNNWFNSGHWDPMILPGPGDNVVIPSFGSNTRPVALTGIASIMGLDWQASRIGEGGTLNVHGAARLGSPFSNTMLILEDRTTLNFFGGVTQFGSLRLLGVVSNAPGSVYVLSTESNGTGSISGNGTFNNAGSFVVNVSGNEWAGIDAQFNNSGTLTVQTGTFNLDGGGSQAGHFHIQPGSRLGLNTLHINGGNAPLEFLAGSSIRNDGVLLGTGGTIRLVGPDIQYSGDGAIMATGDTFTISLPGTLTPREVAIRNGATLDLQSSVRAASFSFFNGHLAGTLDVSGLAAFGGEWPFDRQAIAPGATLRLEGGAVHAGAQLTIDGTLHNEAGSTFAINGLVRFGTVYGGVVDGVGLFANAGTVVQDAAGEQTRVYSRFDNAGDVTVQTGTLGLYGGGTHSGRFVVADGTALQLGGGNHRFESTSTFTNGGVLVVSGGTVDFSGGSFAGNGAIRSTGGVLTVSFGSGISPGWVDVAGGSILVRSLVDTPRFQMDSGRLEIVETGSLVVGADGVRIPNSGSLIVNGRLEARVLLAGGSLGGHGRIEGDVQNLGGVITPQRPEDAVGELTISGDFEMLDALASIQFVIGGTTPISQYSVLTVGGSATLNGVLQLGFTHGFYPQLGDQFTVLNYGSHVGSFAELMVTGLAPEYIVNLTYGESALQLSIGAAVPEPATWLLSLAGVVAAGAMGRRRRGRTSLPH